MPSDTTAGASPGSLVFLIAPSASGALAAGAYINITSSGRVFAAAGAASVALSAESCGASGAVLRDNRTLAVLLADSGTLCSLDSSGAWEIVVSSNLAPNPEPGTVVTFDLVTSADTSVTAAQHGYVTTGSAPSWLSSWEDAPIPQPASTAFGVSAAPLLLAFSVSSSGGLVQSGAVTVSSSHRLYDASRAPAVRMAG